MAWTRQRYNDDPDIRDVPLSVEEGQWVAENPKSVRGSDAVSHLAARAAATARQLRETRVSMDEEMRRRTAAMPSRGVQSTLSPETAARFLSPEQLSTLFDRLAQDKLATLDRQRQYAADAQAAACQVLQWVIDHPGTPGELREHAMSALSHVQEER